MNFPKFNHVGSLTKKKITSFLGLNYTENFQEGELKDSIGLTSEKFPVLTPRKGRESQATFADVTDVYEWDGKMVIVSAGNLWFDGVRIVAVNDKPKQYAVVNTHLIVMPDGIDIDMTSDTTSESGERTFSFKYLNAEIKTSTVGDTATSTWSSGKNIQTTPNPKISEGHRLYNIDRWDGYPWGNADGSQFIGPCIYSYGTDINAVAACFKNGAWDMDALGRIEKLAAPLYDTYQSIFPGTIQFNRGQIFILSGNRNTYELVIATNNSNTHNLPDKSLYGSEGMYAVFKDADVYYFDTNGQHLSRTYFDIYSAKDANKLFSAYFEVGDFVSCDNIYDPAYSFSHAKITAISDASNTITVNFYDETAQTWTKEAFSTTQKSFKGGLEIKKDYPKLDFVCEKSNRLWGVSNADKTIYASSLGKPGVMYEYDGVDTDSYAVAVGSEGDFTAITSYGDAVVCFKEHTIHKILGDYPSNYYMSQYKVDGVQKGSHKSLCNINETLFYKGVNGVYAYTGSTPSLISQKLGRDTFHAAVGGSDGQRYYISMHDSSENAALYVYDLQNGLWLKEDDIYVDAFTKLTGIEIDHLVEDQFYFCSGGTLYRANTNNDEQFEWYAEFVPFETMGASSYGYTRSFSKQGLIKLNIVIDTSRNSRVTVKVKEDDSRWRLCKTVTSVKDHIAIVPVRLGRCERVTLRIEGKGRAVIRGIERDYVVGSEV